MTRLIILLSLLALTSCGHSRLPLQERRTLPLAVHVHIDEAALATTGRLTARGRLVNEGRKAIGIRFGHPLFKMRIHRLYGTTIFSDEIPRGWVEDLRPPLIPEVPLTSSYGTTVLDPGESYALCGPDGGQPGTYDFPHQCAWVSIPFPHVLETAQYKVQLYVTLNNLHGEEIHLYSAPAYIEVK